MTSYDAMLEKLEAYTVNPCICILRTHLPPLSQTHPLDSSWSHCPPSHIGDMDHVSNVETFRRMTCDSIASEFDFPPCHACIQVYKLFLRTRKVVCFLQNMHCLTLHVATPELNILLVYTVLARWHHCTSLHYIMQ